MLPLPVIYASETSSSTSVFVFWNISLLSVELCASHLYGDEDSNGDVSMQPNSGKKIEGSEEWHDKRKLRQLQSM